MPRATRKKTISSSWPPIIIQQFFLDFMFKKRNRIYIHIHIYTYICTHIYTTQFIHNTYSHIHTYIQYIFILTKTHIVKI